MQTRTTVKSEKNFTTSELVKTEGGENNLCSNLQGKKRKEAARLCLCVLVCMAKEVYKKRTGITEDFENRER